MLLIICMHGWLAASYLLGLQAATEGVSQIVQPWLYFNIVLRNSQIFLPVLDLVNSCKRCSTEQQWICSPQAARLHEPQALHSVCCWCLL